MEKGVVSDEGQLFLTKTCPNCGQMLFDDMDVCYACLHEPGMDGAGESWDEEPVPTEAYVEEGCLPDVAFEGSLATSMHLRMVTGDVEATIPLPPGGMTIGRDSSCDIVLRSRSVSRHHVRIEQEEGDVVVYDQGATNLATLRGEKLAGQGRMAVGDTLGICGASFTLQRAPL